MFSKIRFLLLSQHFWIIGFARNNLHMFTFNQPTLAGSIKTTLVNKADIYSKDNIHNLAKGWWSIEIYLDNVLKAAVYFILYLYNMLRQPWNRGGGPFCQTSTLLNKKILMLVAPEREGIDLLQKYSRGKITSKIQFNRDHGNQSTSSSFQISRYFGVFWPFVIFLHCSVGSACWLNPAGGNVFTEFPLLLCKIRYLQKCLLKFPPPLSFV